MITLEQAIELATKAHEGQWRKPSALNGQAFLAYGIEVERLPYHDTNWKTLSDGCQIRLNGSQAYRKPYITHPLAVMEMMDTEEEKIVAVLHDVFENNTEYQLSYMPTDEGNLYSILSIPETNSIYSQQNYPINERLWAALYSLTKPNSDWDKFKEKGHYQSYQGYIKDITLNKTATKVKIADIVHNLSCSPSDHAKEKYLKAMPVLLKSL